MIPSDIQKEIEALTKKPYSYSRRALEDAYNLFSAKKRDELRKQAYIALKNSHLQLIPFFSKEQLVGVMTSGAENLNYLCETWIPDQKLTANEVAELLKKPAKGQQLLAIHTNYEALIRVGFNHQQLLSIATASVNLPKTIDSLVQHAPSLKKLEFTFQDMTFIAQRRTASEIISALIQKETKKTLTRLKKEFDVTRGEIIQMVCPRDASKRLSDLPSKLRDAEIDMASLAKDERRQAIKKAILDYTTAVRHFEGSADQGYRSSMYNVIKRQKRNEKARAQDRLKRKEPENGFALEESSAGETAVERRNFSGQTDFCDRERALTRAVGCQTETPLEEPSPQDVFKATGNLSAFNAYEGSNNWFMGELDENALGFEWSNLNNEPVPLSPVEEEISGSTINVSVRTRIDDDPIIEQSNEGGAASSGTTINVHLSFFKSSPQKRQRKEESKTHGFQL